jgi:hypothetical protein
VLGEANDKEDETKDRRGAEGKDRRSMSLRAACDDVGCLMQPVGGWRLQRLDRPPDPHPQEPAVIIATVEHQVGALRRFKLAIPVDQRIGGAPNGYFRNHDRPMEAYIEPL